MEKRVARYMMDSSPSKEYDTHHKIGQCNRSRANVNNENNKMAIKKNVHHALNTLFNMNQSPHEQLIQLRSMYDSVLSDVAKQLFDDLLDLDKQNFYKK